MQENGSEKGILSRELRAWTHLKRLRIMYKTRLPFLLVFNKTDVQSHDFAVEWMTDFEAYQRALAQSSANGEGGYMNSLMGSMCLMLEEFYNNLKVSRKSGSLLLAALGNDEGGVRMSSPSGNRSGCLLCLRASIALFSGWSQVWTNSQLIL